MIYLKKYKKQSPRFAWASLAVGVLGLFESYQASSQAADIAGEQANQQRKALEAQQRAANVQAQQEKIKQIREARIARARVLSQSATAGMGVGTSGVVGAVGSISSQAAANIGTISQTQSFSDMASAANIQAANLAGQGAQAQAVAAQWQSLSNIGFSAFNQMEGWKKLNPEVKKAAPTMSTSRFLSTSQYNFGG